MADDVKTGTTGTGARMVANGATIVALSVLADSGMEHYRGSFRNPAMTLPLVSSALEIAFSGVGRGSTRAPVVRSGGHAAAVTVGLLGLGFHAFNVGKRPGGVTFTNMFYGAPHWRARGAGARGRARRCVRRAGAGRGRWVR